MQISDEDQEQAHPVQRQHTSRPAADHALFKPIAPPVPVMTHAAPGQQPARQRREEAAETRLGKTFEEQLAEQVQRIEQQQQSQQRVFHQAPSGGKGEQAPVGQQQSEGTNLASQQRPPSQQQWEVHHAREEERAMLEERQRIKMEERQRVEEWQQMEERRQAEERQRIEATHKHEAMQQHKTYNLRSKAASKPIAAAKPAPARPAAALKGDTVKLVAVQKGDKRGTSPVTESSEEQPQSPHSDRIKVPNPPLPPSPFPTLNSSRGVFRKMAGCGSVDGLTAWRAGV